MWIPINQNRCHCYGKAPGCFLLIIAIFDTLNSGTISFAGRGEPRLYFFHVILHEYDAYILWCFLCCKPPFSLYRVSAKCTALGGCMTGFGTNSDDNNHVSGQCKLMSYTHSDIILPSVFCMLRFVLYCAIYLSHPIPRLMLLHAILNKDISDQCSTNSRISSDWIRPHHRSTTPNSYRRLLHRV